jgi:polygalacturonase
MAMAGSVTVTKLVLTMASLVMLLLSDARRLQTAATLSSNAGPANAARQNVFVLDNYGARGDEKHDDTQALTRAWSAACSSSRPAVLLIPKGKSYLLKAITLSGPCKSSVVLMVNGALVAPPRMSAWSESDRSHWIMIQDVAGLTVTGGGMINGNGDMWWKNSCKTDKALPCTAAPTALTFHRCSNLNVENLKLVNSQQIHMSVEDLQ